MQAATHASWSIELSRVAAFLGCLSARPDDLRLGGGMCLGLRTDDAGLKFPSSV